MKFRLHRLCKKDLERLKHSGCSMRPFKEFLHHLESPKLPEKYRTHPLKGSFAGTWDAHLAHNWVVLFRYLDTDTIELLRTGTHASVGIG